MGTLDRIYRIERLLQNGGVVTMARLVEDLEVSRATIKRDLDYLRDRLNAPVIWDREVQGYRLGSSASLPTVYLTPEEIQALLVLHEFVNRINPGIAEREFAMLHGLLIRLGTKSAYAVEELNQRIRIIQIGSRKISGQVFEALSNALLQRKQAHILYFVRSRGEETARAVSPQRLVYYRNNWYMDAWCHLRGALRSFALDAVRRASVLETEAVEVKVERLDAELGAGYGIFSGAETLTAKLRFSPKSASWVSAEHWHSAQKGYFDENGFYILEVPYSSERELVMDILRYGPDVEVINPKALRDLVVGTLRRSLEQY